MSKCVIRYMRLPVPDRSPWKEPSHVRPVSFGPFSRLVEGLLVPAYILNVALVSIFFSLRLSRLGGSRGGHPTSPVIELS